MMSFRLMSLLLESGLFMMKKSKVHVYDGSPEPQTTKARRL